MNLFDRIGIDSGYIIIIMFVIIAILFLYTLALSNLVKKYKRRQDIFLQGNDGKNLEQAIINRFKELSELKKQVEESTETVNALKEYSSFTFQKFAVNKYDAYEGMGGKRSFSVCLLTDNNDGIIITAIHNEIGGCFTYIKEIIRGESYVVLSAEEKKALENAKVRRSCLDD